MAEPTKFVVAVVDDDSRTLESLADLLEAAGYDVRRYSSGTGAWNHGDWSKVDCLISDIGMPEMNGFDLRRLALSVRPDLPVLLITGRSEFRAQYASMIERDRYFEKPFDGQQLLAAIRTALGNARPRRDS
jgi:FixJ family two-component response regulator